MHNELTPPPFPANPDDYIIGIDHAFVPGLRMPRPDAIQRLADPAIPRRERRRIWRALYRQNGTPWRSHACGAPHFNRVPYLPLKAEELKFRRQRQKWYEARLAADTEDPSPVFNGSNMGFRYLPQPEKDAPTAAWDNWERQVRRRLQTLESHGPNRAQRRLPPFPPVAPRGFAPIAGDDEIAGG